MHHGTTWLGMAAVAFVATSALAQVENADLRIRADFRTPDNGQWGANESVGNADFRVHSRFLQLYYGGVHRNDEFRFTVQLDFTTISDFATSFTTSMYNTDFDIYINNAYVGRALMANGIAELQYDSRHADFPTLPLPANFPDPVNTFDIVRVYAASAALPAIGDPLPAGQAIMQKELTEKFARGDVNQDGKVDLVDFPFLATAYDPWHVLGNHIGPANGDFTGDNKTDLADYQMFVQNWTPHNNPPAEPAPVGFCPSDLASNAGAGPDGGVDVNDLMYYLEMFEAGAVQADMDNGSSTGTADGGVDISDLLFFLQHFELGC